MNYCESPALGNLLIILKNILTLIQIIGPLLLIIFLVITLTKLISNPDEKKYKKNIKNELLGILFLFAVPIIINAFMLMLDDSLSIAKCWNNAKKYSSNSTYKNTNDNKKNKVNPNKGDYEKGEERKDNNNDNDNSSSNTEPISGTGNFIKYSLSESQLNALTALAIHEQGTTKGAAAEASLMANRFELYGSKYGSGADGLVNYVKNSGWFAHASRNMSDTGVITESAKQAVRSVLIDGKRTLPGYIDEHDCLSDISSISTGSVNDRNAYKQFVTKIHNKYGSNYTFYSFPDSNSDPFGYTSEEKRKQIGDNSYSS